MAHGSPYLGRRAGSSPCYGLCGITCGDPFPGCVGEAGAVGAGPVAAAGFGAAVAPGEGLTIAVVAAGVGVPGRVVLVGFPVWAPGLSSEDGPANSSAIPTPAAASTTAAIASGKRQRRKPDDANVSGPPPPLDRVFRVISAAERRRVLLRADAPAGEPPLHLPTCYGRQNNRQSAAAGDGRVRCR